METRVRFNAQLRPAAVPRFYHSFILTRFRKFTIQSLFFSLVLCCTLFMTSMVHAQSDMTTIDVHAHAWIFDGRASAQQLLDLMTANNISKVVMMQPPMPGYDDTDISSENSENLRNFFLINGNSFLYMYGGKELQPLLYASGHTGTITLAELFPNGAATM
jgi:hypothetical protein